MTAYLIDEIAQYLAANGIGTLGTNIFEGDMPTTPDACICIYETTGLAAEHDIPLHSPSFQVMIRNTELDLGQAVAFSIRNLLHNQYNLQFATNGTYVYSCNLIAEGGHIGRDDNGRDLFSLNFQCKVR